MTDPDDLARDVLSRRILDQHHPGKSEPARGWCSGCGVGTPWPCDAHQAATALLASEARVRRLTTALRVATHSPHDQLGEPVEGFPVCSVCGAIQTGPPDPADPCTCGHRRDHHIDRDVDDVVGWPCLDCRSTRCRGFLVALDADGVAGEP